MNKNEDLKDKIKTYFGLITILISLVLIGFAFYFDKSDNVIAFLACLIAGIWAFSYGMMTAMTRKLLYSLYYPTVTLLLISFPPLLTAWLTYNPEHEWIQILSTCLAAVLGLTLFSVFGYYSIYLPNKKQNLYVNENKNLFKHLRNLAQDYRAIIVNKKDDAALITGWRNKHKVIVVKAENGTHVLVKEDSFVEYHNAYYFAVKSVVDLYKVDDKRPEQEFKEELTGKYDLKNYLNEFNKLLKKEGFTERFVMETWNTNNGSEYVLVLKHLSDPDKTIEFTYDAGAILYYLGTHIHFYYDDFEETSVEVFNSIIGILTDKVVVYSKKNAAGHIVMSESYDLKFFNTYKNCRKKSIMKNNKIVSWSGKSVCEILKDENKL